MTKLRVVEEYYYEGKIWLPGAELDLNCTTEIKELIAAGKLKEVGGEEKYEEPPKAKAPEPPPKPTKYSWEE